ncbi:MAG: GNAT family N-acetyltransferase [Caulobacterales bacterium]|nr:GNAT family N-acetyltransferase [Caulobacterales bacterium]
MSVSDVDRVQLQAASEADFAEIIALTNHAFRHTGDGASWNAEDMIAGDRITESLLRDDLAAAPDGHLLIWRDEAGQHLGHVRLDPDPGGVWFLGMLTVRPDRQDQKLGRRLLAAAEDFARARGATRIRMTVVDKRETLIAWYLRRGYALTGETKPFPYGDDRIGIPTRDDLAFVVLERAL